MQSSEGENKRETEPERKTKRCREKNHKATRATAMQREREIRWQRLGNGKKTRKKKFTDHDYVFRDLN